MYIYIYIYIRDSVPLRGNTCLGCGPSNRSSFGAEGSSFSRQKIKISILAQKAATSMQNAALGARPRWAAQRLSKVVDLGVGGGGG